MTYRLINAAPSPYGRKVAVAMHEKGIVFEMILDQPWAEAKHTRLHSPLQQLPILLTDGGESVFDSAFILDWLEIVHPEVPLMPVQTCAHLSAMKVRVLGERLMEIAQARVFEAHRVHAAPATIARLETKIAGGLAVLETLAEVPVSPAEPCNLGQIAVATTLLCWEYIVAQGMSPPLEVLVWRGRYPQLTALADAMVMRTSFEATEPAPMEVDIVGEVA